jgi:esterase/lipase superfamily enzyme
VESPSILRLEVRPDASKHVVLQSVEPLADDAFYSQLQDAVKASPRRELLVFIHGFNVSFDDAVRRTAQIAFDLKFSGAPVCYSWPSQGGILKYTVDETNAAWTVPHLKQFLLSIVGRTGAESINLIAHSMGNRALTSALRDVALEMRERKALFNQVILAATARQFTLYASSDDQALRASRKVHGYPRAGDSGDDLVVVNGIQTIDVSGIDTSFLGHSYYASNDAILADLHELVHGAMPAARRSLLSPAVRDGLPYWVLKGAAATALRAARQR